MQLYNSITIISSKYQVYIHTLCNVSTINTQGVVDSSGIVFTYIDTPRQYDAGILFLGHAVAPVMIIPPNANNFTTIGLCSNPCTNKVSIM